MGYSPYYPAGVTDEMIDYYFGDHGECCAKCENFYGGTCTLKANRLTADEEEAMTQKEYDDYITVEDDDYCDDFEWREEEPPYDEDARMEEDW